MLEDVLRQLCADLRAHIRVVQVNILVSNELEKTEGLLLPIVGRLMLASLLQVLHRVEPSLAIRQGLFNRPFTSLLKFLNTRRSAAMSVSRGLVL